jgi:hypothetical protein
MRLIIYFIFVTLFIATTWIGSSEGCTSHMIEEKIVGKLSQITDESTGTLQSIIFLSYGVVPFPFFIEFITSPFGF